MVLHSALLLRKIIPCIAALISWSAPLLGTESIKVYGYNSREPVVFSQRAAYVSGHIRSRYEAEARRSQVRSISVDVGRDQLDVIAPLLENIANHLPVNLAGFSQYQLEGLYRTASTLEVQLLLDKCRQRLTGEPPTDSPPVVTPTPRRPSEARESLSGRRRSSTVQQLTPRLVKAVPFSVAQVQYVQDVRKTLIPRLEAMENQLIKAQRQLISAESREHPAEFNRRETEEMLRRFRSEMNQTLKLIEVPQQFRNDADMFRRIHLDKLVRKVFVDFMLSKFHPLGVEQQINGVLEKKVPVRHLFRLSSQDIYALMATLLSHDSPDALRAGEDMQVFFLLDEEACEKILPVEVRSIEPLTEFKNDIVSAVERQNYLTMAWMKAFLGEEFNMQRQILWQEQYHLDHAETLSKQARQLEVAYGSNARLITVLMDHRVHVRGQHRRFFREHVHQLDLNKGLKIGMVFPALVRQAREVLPNFCPETVLGVFFDRGDLRRPDKRLFSWRKLQERVEVASDEMELFKSSQDAGRSDILIYDTEVQEYVRNWMEDPAFRTMLNASFDRFTGGQGQVFMGRLASYVAQVEIMLQLMYEVRMKIISQEVGRRTGVDLPAVHTVATPDEVRSVLLTWLDIATNLGVVRAEDNIISDIFRIDPSRIQKLDHINLPAVAESACLGLRYLIDNRFYEQAYHILVYYLYRNSLRSLHHVYQKFHEKTEDHFLDVSELSVMLGEVRSSVM